MSKYHVPVMPIETIEFLNIQKGLWYIDCNLGGGGHTNLILQKGGKVLGLDLDLDAIKEVAKNYSLKITSDGVLSYAESEYLILYQTNFADLDRVVQKFNLKIAGVLFDLGVSSFQLEEASRGFSFNQDAPLDMRMNQKFGARACDLINALPEKALAKIFWEYGEERFSKIIAKKILEERKKVSINTTNQLANIILKVRNRSNLDRTHPATRVFQALRIAVNDELRSLEEALPKAFNIMVSNGRLVVISFHSLEDRIVKNYFKSLESQNFGNILTKKPIEPSNEEILSNPRSRSGKLRVVEKI